MLVWCSRNLSIHPKERKFGILDFTATGACWLWANDARSWIFRILIFAPTTEPEFSVNLHHFCKALAYFLSSGIYFWLMVFLPISKPRHDGCQKRWKSLRAALLHAWSGGNLVGDSDGADIRQCTWIVRDRKALTIAVIMPCVNAACPARHGRLPGYRDTPVKADDRRVTVGVWIPTVTVAANTVTAALYGCVYGVVARGASKPRLFQLYTVNIYSKTPLIGHPCNCTLIARSPLTPTFHFSGFSQPI